MASQFKIIIQNQSSQTTSFFAFQKEAWFDDSGATPTILTSSLASGALAPHAASGAQLTFGFDKQVYAGAKSTMTSAAMVNFNALISLVSVASSTSQTSAAQPIELTPASGQSDNFTVMTISPLGLSAPAYQSGLQAGSFGIQVPTYSPAPTPELYCGCAVINQDGSITLSSFIAPMPGSQVDCAPLPVYFVKAGTYTVGEVITYDTTQAAKCDFTQGYSVINVTFNQDGSFTTSGS